MNNIVFKKIRDFFNLLLLEKIHIALILIFLVAIFLILFKLFFLAEIAIYKSKNPNNIKSSCLYLISEQYSKQGRTKIVEIDGRIYRTGGYTLTGYLLFYKTESQFPFYHKNKNFYGKKLFWDKIVKNQNTCYEIKYIRALNLIFIDFIYLYDFEIPKEFRSYENKFIQ